MILPSADVQSATLPNLITTNTSVRTGLQDTPLFCAEKDSIPSRPSVHFFAQSFSLGHYPPIYQQPKVDQNPPNNFFGLSVFFFFTGSRFWRGRKTGGPGEKPISQIAEVGGASEEYSANLSSQGIQQREDTQMVDHQNNNPAQRDIISVIKMETKVCSLGQAV